MTSSHSLHTLADLRPGHHLCCLYETEEEHRGLLTPFLRSGLERGEKVVYIVDAHTADTVLGYLRDDGVDPEPYVASGQLSILAAEGVYTRDGPFDPDAMIALLRSETERALAQGYTALRATAEMTWALRGLPGSERLIEYEAKLNRFYPGSKCLGLCQYDRRRFEPEILLEVLATHPILVVGTEFCDGIYYAPSGESLGSSRPAHELQERLDRLAERKRAEQLSQLLTTILDLLNRHDAEDAIRSILLAIKSAIGIEACAIRLKGGEDYPYYVASGFPAEFVEAESSLCARDAEGMLVRDAQGQPVLECMCGNVLQGRVNPALPFFTPGGSFWTNSTTDLLASTTEADRQGRTRNRCNTAGYESVALIPLRTDEETIGLLQLNDHRRGCFTLAMIEFFEHAGRSIGVALHCKRAEAALREAHDELERRVEQRTTELAGANQALQNEVAERTRAEEQINRLNEGLKRHLAVVDALNKELESFSYSVSHDLRAPLRSMVGFSKAFLEDCGEALDEQGKHYLERIQAGCGHMAELIEDLLKLSRVTASEMRYETVDLSEMARRIATELRTSQPERDTEFIIADGLVVHGDRHLLRILLQNLMDNAWKFTSKHSRARMELGATETEDGRAYFVRDDGAGFDMTYAHTLFAPFQRLHPQAEFPGTGIGLATAQRIVRRHGGRVWTQAAVEQGATFYFTL